MTHIIDLHRQFRRACVIEDGLQPQYVHDMRITIELFVRLIQISDIQEITTDVIRQFFEIGREQRQWQAATYRNKHKHLKRFLNWCVENDYIKDKNPIDVVKIPKLPKRLPRCLSYDEVQKILHASLSIRWRYDFESERNYALIATLAYTGMRANELLNLKIVDVDLREGTIFIERGKGQKDRYIPIHPKLTRVLRRYLAERDKLKKVSMHFFTGVQSNIKLDYKYLRQMCQKIGKKTGVKFTPHMLRHTFATMCITQGMGLPKVQYLLGHGNIQSTMIYTWMSKTTVAEEFQKIDLF